MKRPRSRSTGSDEPKPKGLNRFGRPTKPRTPEVAMYRAVLDVLRLHGVMAWRQNNQPGVRVERRIGRAQVVARLTPVEFKGMADIGGICPGGRAIQIECKRDEGQPTPEQAAWLSTVHMQDGIAVLARSVQDVARLCQEARAVGWDRVASPWSREVNAAGAKTAPRR